MPTQEKIDQLFTKIKKFQEEGNVMDLSSGEDLAIAIMNLISLEEHFSFTYEKTKDQKYLELLKEVRELRKTLLAKIVKNPQGEVWCISKHLLASIMRLLEVGEKKLGQGKQGETKELFQKAYLLWNMFWGLNLDLIKVQDLPKEEKEDLGINKAQGSPKEEDSPKKEDLRTIKKVTVWDKLGTVVKSIVNCCKE